MLAFVFPGQGSQKVGMGLLTAKQYPLAKQVYDQADEALGWSISKLCFEGPEDKLELTAYSQPAILTTSIAILRVLEHETGLSPVVVAGHSLGEYSALVCAGAIRFEDAVRIVHKRGLFMQEAVPTGQGGMAAVMGMETTAVEKLCQDAAEGKVLSPANFNAPSQIVIAGHSDAIERALKLAKDRGGIAKALKVSAPFHCALMEPAAVKLATELKTISFSNPRIPVIANVDASLNREGAKIANLLTRQVTAPVRWIDSVKQLANFGVKEIIEIGSGAVLSGLIKRIDKSFSITKVEIPEHIEKLI